MRCLLLLATLCMWALPGTMAFGLSVQECLDIKDVYGWAPDSCSQQLSDSPTASAPYGATANATLASEPSAQQIEDHVFFPSGGTTLDQTALAQIELLTQLMNLDALGDACLALVGHSDISGGEISNMKVAKARADAVARELRKRLQNPEKVERILAAGESVPLDNLSPRSRWQRRVEIRARDCDISM